MGFRFADHSAFQLLWIVPIVALAALYLWRRHRQQLHKLIGARLVPFLTASLSQPRRRLKLALECLALMMFILALARPQMGESQEEIRSEGVEMVIALDVSNSMLAEDVRPSRLEFAKRELSRLLDEMPGDKVGLLAFAGSAALLSPMTTDKSALKMFLEDMGPESVSAQGTELRRALLEAESAFARGGAGGDEQGAQDLAQSSGDEARVTRVVLLASDGEDNEPGALELAKKLAERGVRIYAVGFGSEKGAPIPVRDAAGEVRGYKRDSQGQVVLSQTKGTVLRELAKVGGGEFFQADFGADTVRELKAAINRLEKTEFENQMVTNYAERYQPILFFGFILALLELLLGERVRRRGVWRGRFEVGKQ